MLLQILFCQPCHFSQASGTNQSTNKPLRAFSSDWLLTARAVVPFVMSQWRNTQSENRNSLDQTAFKSSQSINYKQAIN